MNVEFTLLALMKNKWEKISLKEFHIEYLFIWNFRIGFGTVVKWSHMWIIFLCIYMDLWKRKSIFESLRENAWQTAELFCVSFIQKYRKWDNTSEDSFTKGVLSCWSPNIHRTHFSVALDGFWVQQHQMVVLSADGYNKCFYTCANLFQPVMKRFDFTSDWLDYLVCFLKFWGKKKA